MPGLIQLLSFDMGNQVSDSDPQWFKISVNNIIYKVCVYIEVAMSYMVSHPHYAFPWYFRTYYAQQSAFSTFIDFLNPFAYGFQ